MRTSTVFFSIVAAAASSSALAADFNQFGSAEPDFVAAKAEPDLIFELGGMGEFRPAYEGASKYRWGFNPIINIERLNIPGLGDGRDHDGAGLSFSPSARVIAERKSANYSELAGLKNIDTTYALGAKVGYDFDLTDQIRAGVYTELLYGFGGSKGLLGDMGAELTAKLTPQLEVISSVSASFASEGYMDTYFGVSATEAARTGGRLQAYHASAGLKSVGASLSARYEFVPDTFLNVTGSYSQLVRDAASSPITQHGKEQQFIIGLGISRRFSFSY